MLGFLQKFQQPTTTTGGQFEVNDFIQSIMEAYGHYYLWANNGLGLGFLNLDDPEIWHQNPDSFVPAQDNVDQPAMSGPCSPLAAVAGGNAWDAGASQVQQLVNAMASFTGQSGDLAAPQFNYLPSSVQAVIAAASPSGN